MDECHLFFWPVVLGGGKPSLPLRTRLDLELVSERRSRSGVVTSTTGSTVEDVPWGWIHHQAVLGTRFRFDVCPDQPGAPTGCGRPAPECHVLFRYETSL